jgi:hypothetical protein
MSGKRAAPLMMDEDSQATIKRGSMRSIATFFAALLAAAALIAGAGAYSPAWQRVDSIAFGLHIPDYRGSAALSAEVPAHWVRSDMPEPNVISFAGPESTGENEVYVVFRADRRSAGATLASEAKAIKTRLAEGADNYRLLSERSTQIAKRPAIVFSMQFSGSDSPALLREDVAIVDAGEVIYFIHFGATQARYAANSHVFPHILETIGFTP